MTPRPLKFAVIGPKGQCGSCVVDELLSRGHTVVDIHNHEALAEILSDNFDGILNAFAPSLVDLNTIYHGVVEGHMRIKEALLASTHTGPFIIIGGAGSLFNEKGVQLVDEKDFPFQHWLDWPDEHLNYMKARASGHGSRSFTILVSLFHWSRNTMKSQSALSLPLKPIAWFILRRFKPVFLSGPGKGLITGCRTAFALWTGVTVKPWSFLSPPWLLRDQGIRTGKYDIILDRYPTDEDGNHLGIYNEDMAVAIADECENNALNHMHWSCSGQIGLGKW